MKLNMVRWFLLCALYLFVILFAHKAIKIFEDFGSD